MAADGSALTEPYGEPVEYGGARMRKRADFWFLLFFVGPVLVYLGVLLAVAVFVVTPSTLGWIGFGVVAFIGLLIGLVAARLYPLTRTNAVRLQPRPGEPLRLLVVADVGCDNAALCRGVQRRIGGQAAEVVVVAPVLASPLHFLTDAEPSERDNAKARLNEALARLARLGIAARGVVGSDDPLQAIGDALTDFPAGEIMLAAPATSTRHWLEQDLERKVCDVYGVPLSVLDLEDDERAGEATKSRPLYPLGEPVR
jgi:hypothetical protein